MDHTDLQSAGKDALALEKAFRGLFKTAQAVKELGDLGQARAEAMRLAQEARERLEEAKASLAVVEDKEAHAEQAAADARDVASQAKQDAARLENEATKAAENLIDKAREQGDEVVRKAHNQAQAEVRQYDSVIADRKAALQAADQELIERQRQVKEVKDELAALKSRLG